MSPRLRAVAANLALALISITIVLALAEVAARLAER
jgi:hypothetical protein